MCKYTIYIVYPIKFIGVFLLYVQKHNSLHIFVIYNQNYTLYEKAYYSLKDFELSFGKNAH